MNQPPDSLPNRGPRIADLAARPRLLSLRENPCLKVTPLEEKAQQPSSLDLRVLNVLRIVQASCCDPNLKFANIAAMLGISGSRLQHLLRRDTGASFGWHLNTQRTRQAAILLRGSTLLVKEIASKVGFRNTLSLERHFKAFFECTPSEYRHRSRLDETNRMAAHA